MINRKVITFASIVVAVFSLTVLTTSGGAAQTGTKLPKKIYIQAQAMGTSTQLGRNFSVTAIINELSPPEDQKILFEAFQTKGNEGLVNALEKMPSKGRLAITGTLGGDLAYIRRVPMPDGSVMIRMVTNRLLRFGEVWADSRSSEYDLSGMEVIISKDKKHNKGTLFPAAKLKLNKEQKIEIELYQNPWNLVNIQLR
jgi:hypothetical protein